MDLFYSALNISIVWLTPRLCAVMGQTCRDAIQFRSRLRYMRNQYNAAVLGIIQTKKQMLSTSYKTEPLSKSILGRLYYTIVCLFRVFIIGPKRKRFTVYRYVPNFGLFYMRQYNSKTAIMGFIGNPFYDMQLIYNYYAINNKLNWVDKRSYYTYRNGHIVHDHDCQTIKSCIECSNIINEM